MAPKAPDPQPSFTDASGTIWEFDADTTAWLVKHNPASGKLTHVSAWISTDAEVKRRLVALLNGKPLFDAATPVELQQLVLAYSNSA